MTRVDEFNSFYEASSAQTLQVLYAGTGNRQLAHESTIEAYCHAWRDWSKIRHRDARSYVHNEAWKNAALRRGTHPLRRRHEEDSDTELLDALGAIPVDDRRLIILLTLGNLDLDDASRQVGVPAEEGIEKVTTALTGLEKRCGQSIDQIERRLHALSVVTDSLKMPTAAVVRARAKRGTRRNAAVLVAVATALVLGGGFLVTDGDALARNTQMPEREKIGAESPDLVLNAHKVDESNLLSTSQVRQLDRSHQWTIKSTDTNANKEKPYATCPAKRFADPDPARVVVRTFKAAGSKNETVAQSIEVSSSEHVAMKSYQRLLGWYANCSLPRVQLVDSFTVKRPFGDFQILRLRSHRSPERTFTVGLSHSGTVTSTVVHEIDDAKGPDVKAFARVLNDSVTKVCSESGGNCTRQIRVENSDPPETEKLPGFLGVVDLPPVASVDKVWVGSDQGSGSKDPTTTLCSKANFNAKGASAAHSRVFLIPEAKELPPQFGIAETVAAFDSTKSAKAYVKKVSAAVDKCPKSNLSASVDQSKAIKGDGIVGHSWREAFEVDKNKKIYYRTAIVRHGLNVAKVTFTSAPSYDVSSKVFTQLAHRAGQRLDYFTPTARSK